MFWKIDLTMFPTRYLMTNLDTDKLVKSCLESGTALLETDAALFTWHCTFARFS